MPTPAATLDWPPLECYDEQIDEMTSDTGLVKPTFGPIRVHHETLEAEIESSKDLLTLQYELEDNPEENCSDMTLQRATAFLRLQNDALWDLHGRLLPVPAIGLGPGASIDLYWKTETWELLVNIPGGPDELATFYGSDNRQQVTKGSFNPNGYSQAVAACLMS